MIALWVAGGLLGAGVLVLDRVSLQILRPYARPADPHVESLDAGAERLTIRSGRFELAGWLLRPAGEPVGPLLVLAHGWGANHSLLLPLAVPLVEEGFEVLVFDVRGHGDSAPAPYATVRHFRDDVAAVVDFARARWPERRLAVVGHSLGGAAAVLAAAEGARFDGLALVAAPADVIAVTADYLTRRGLPGGLMTKLFLPFWWRRARSLFGPLTPVRRISELKAPVLVVQPETDHRVPRDHAERMAAAAGVELHVVAGAEHNDVLGAAETRRLVTRFLQEL